MNESPRAFSYFLSEKNFYSFSHILGKESLRKNHKQEPKLSFLVKALYTMAYALDAYRAEICGRDTVGVCQKLEKSFNHSTFFVR